MDLLKTIMSVVGIAAVPFALMLVYRLCRDAWRKLSKERLAGEYRARYVQLKAEPTTADKWQEFLSDVRKSQKSLLPHDYADILGEVAEERGCARGESKGRLDAARELFDIGVPFGLAHQLAIGPWRGEILSDNAIRWHRCGTSYKQMLKLEVKKLLADGSAEAFAELMSIRSDILKADSKGAEIFTSLLHETRAVHEWNEAVYQHLGASGYPLFIRLDALKEGDINYLMNRAEAGNESCQYILWYVCHHVRPRPVALSAVLLNLGYAHMPFPRVDFDGDEERLAEED